MSIAERDQQPGAPFSSGSSNGDAQGIERERQLVPYPADPSFDELAYKVLLYLKRCFRGRVLGAAEPLSEGNTAKVG